MRQARFACWALPLLALLVAARVGAYAAERPPLIDYERNILGYWDEDGKPSPFARQTVRVFASTIGVADAAFFEERLYGKGYSVKTHLGLAVTWVGQDSAQAGTRLTAVMNLKRVAPASLAQARSQFVGRGSPVTLLGELLDTGWRKGPQGVGGVLETARFYVLEVTQVTPGWTLTGAADLFACVRATELAKAVGQEAPARATELRRIAALALADRAVRALEARAALATLDLVGLPEDAAPVLKCDALRTPELLPQATALLSHLWSGAPPEQLATTLAGQPSVLRVAIAERFLESWQAEWRAARFDAARPHLARAVAASGGAGPYALLAQALAARRTGGLEQAAELLSKAVEAAPSHAEVRAQRALTWLLLKRRARAKTDAEEALGLDPRQPTAREVLGWVEKASDEELARLAERERPVEGGAPPR